MTRVSEILERIQNLHLVAESREERINTTELQSRLEKIREAIIRGELKRAHEEMNIPPRYWYKTLPDSNLARNALQAIKDGKSLYITGVCGSGKTHLSIALMQIWYADNLRVYEDGKTIYQPKRAWFLPVVELMLEIKQAWTDSVAEKEIIDKYSHIDLLVLDDLGAEKMSEASRQIFYLLLDRRYRHCKQTIITSNLSLNELQEAFDDRIASRICEMGIVVDLGDKDWRVNRKP